MKLHPDPISDSEKILGIARKKQTTGSLLRNWITFILRQTIIQEERIAYHATTKPNSRKVLQKFVHILRFEIQRKKIRYEHENRLSFFDPIITYKGILCTKKDGTYQIENILI